MSLQANRLKPERGWHWLMGGVRLWRSNPVPLSLAVLLVIVVMFLEISVLTQLPVLGGLLGPVAFCLTMPPLYAGVFRLCRAIEKNRGVSLRVLQEGFRHQLRQQLIAGAINLAVSVLAAGVMVWLLGDAMPVDGTAVTGASTAPDAMTPETLRMVLLGTVIWLPMMMAMAFTPQLIGFWGVPAIKAMVFSFIACWRNLLPFLVFWLCFGGLFMALPFMLSALFSQSGSVVGFVAGVVVASAMPIYFAANYVATKEVFLGGSAA